MHVLKKYFILLTIVLVDVMVHDDGYATPIC